LTGYKKAPKLPSAHLRGYEGHKTDFQWLPDQDPETYLLFDQVHGRPGDLAMIRELGARLKERQL
jgi:hypothetical protein